MTTIAYVGASLHHDQVTGRAVTACLHLVNATPSHCHTKRQATVGTATFGSEFVAARIATDQIIDLRLHSHISWSSNQIQKLHVWWYQIFS